MYLAVLIGLFFVGFVVVVDLPAESTLRHVPSVWQDAVGGSLWVSALIALTGAAMGSRRFLPHVDARIPYVLGAIGTLFIVPLLIALVVYMLLAHHINPYEDPNFGLTTMILVGFVASARLFIGEIRRINRLIETDDV